MIGMVEYALYKYLPANVFGAKDLDSMIPALKMFLQSVQPEGCASIMKQLEDAEQQLRFYAPALKKKNRRSTQEILAQYKIKTLEKQLQEQLESGMDQLLTTPESRKIKNLIDRNIVSVYDYGFKEFDVNELTGGYFANLMNAMYNGTAYALNDLRNYFSHLLSQKKMNKFKENALKTLGLSDFEDYKKLYDTLIERLYKLYQYLNIIDW